MIVSIYEAIIVFRGRVCPWLCLKWRSYPRHLTPGSWQAQSPGDAGPEPHHESHSSGRMFLVWRHSTPESWTLPLTIPVSRQIFEYEEYPGDREAITPRNLGSVSGAIREMAGLWVWEWPNGSSSEVTIARQLESTRPGLVSPDTGGRRI